MNIVDLSIDGSEALKLYIYGVKDARTLSEEMQQGFAVLVRGRAVPRADLDEAQRTGLEAYLLENWPQHAKL